MAFFCLNVPILETFAYRKDLMVLRSEEDGKTAEVASQPANPFLFLFLVCGKRRGRVNFLHNENGKILYLLGLARNRGSPRWIGDRLPD